MKSSNPKSVTELLANRAAVTRAMRAGVRAALLEHKRAGRSIVVWENGRVVELPADKIPVNEPRRNGKPKPR